MRRIAALSAWVLLAVLARTLPAQTGDEIKQAEGDVPRLLERLDVRPGMVVADSRLLPGAVSQARVKHRSRTATHPIREAT